METDTVATGGAGFIGSYVCRALPDRGQSVLCTNDRSTGWYGNIAPLRERPTFRFLNADVSHLIDE